jgi:hypothetical protein
MADQKLPKVARTRPRVAAGDGQDAGLDKRLTSVDAPTRRRIEDWAKKLVDLSRRNRLLYYRPTKRTSLTFLQPHPDTVLVRILDGGSYGFYRPPELPAVIPGRARDVSQLQVELQRRRPLERELVATQRDPLEIDRSLDAIDRKARAEFEDRGTHVLYLAWGLLRWVDPKSGDEQRAPLVLVPMELSRSSVTQPYQLRAAADDDAVVNPALRVLLELDFNIRLPELDLDDMAPAVIASRIREELPGSWGVEDNLSIGIFGFAKEAMYRDLVEHANVVARHPVIKSMVKGHPVVELEKVLSTAIPSEDQLDEVDDPGYSVIDADASQRRAIEAANRGVSFVLYGPPGTGKSQTITNIIAEFIGRGKSVLFVSQKMAALEVVAKRLEEVELRDMVLELHSAKASRGEVARALAEALDSHLKPNDALLGPTFTALRSTRATLNAYVAALHERREPLGLSAFDVLAGLTSLANVPAMEPSPVDATSAVADDLSHVIRGAERLSDAWLPVEEGEAFPWWDVTADVTSAAQRERIKELLLRARDAVASAEAFDRRLGDACEWAMPASQDDRRHHARFGEVLGDRKPGPLEWLTTDDLTPYADLLARWAQRSVEHQRLIGELTPIYHDRWRSLPPEAHERLAVTLAGLSDVLGRATDWDRVADGADALRTSMGRLDSELVDAVSRLHALGNALGMPTSDAVRSARETIEVARLSQARNRPAVIWLSRARHGDAEEFLATHGEQYVTQQRMSAQLSERYDDGILALGLDPISMRMQRWHGRWWNRLRPQHRADRAAIQGVTRSKTILPSVIEDLAQARQVRDDRAALAALDPRARSTLGSYAAGLATDVAAASEALQAAKRLVDLAPSMTDWGRLSSVVTAESVYYPDLERQADGLEAALVVMESTIQDVTAQAAPDRQAALLDWERGRLGDWTQRLGTLVGDLSILRAEAAAISQVTSVSDLLLHAQVRAQIEEIETDFGAHEDVLRAVLRRYYEGLASDWAGLGKAVEWAAVLRERYGSGLPEPVARRLVAGELDELPWVEHGRSIAQLDDATDAVAQLFAESTLVRVLGVLGGNSQVARSWLDKRLLRVDDLAVWHAFLAARAEVKRLGWGAFVERAVDRGTARLDLAPAARRAWLEAWFTSLVSKEPALKAFSRAEHERVVDLFREADARQIGLGRERVLRAYSDRKPAPATVQGGEQAVVRREAVKRRKHLPVRTLLKTIPTLLPKIKPCLMMSPLSVSHFLTADAKFDLVVFDEASQVPPEDAVNCIYRGRQLIVAGDPKQLPPTDFFQLSASSELDGEFEDDIDDFESVLELCRGMGLPGHSLEWHYRSRHDALIAFSNHFIYDGSLVTFPAPYQHSDDLGVSFVHAPDAVFDRGRSASNPIEARKVVDVVIEHWRNHPDESLGVVAFSVAQQDAVLDEMAGRLRVQPDLERHLGDGRLDQFFVKNLETVQGDERDVIVFTVGYGRDDQGRVFNNFGALNRPGGARRLNVAVTRARRKVIVVSSIRAGDLRLPEATVQAGSLPPGASLLRAYLDYAERGALPEVLSNGPRDGISPLEKDVARVIRDLGYDLVERVGTSRYRIDLGVVSKVRPGRLALGVECDGEMYRGARTARDRDRLRTTVLRGLDWDIHRVWAPSWCFSRHEEIARLERAITDAEQRIAEARPAENSPATQSNRGERGRVELAEIRVETPEDAVELGWAVYFPVSAIAPYPTLEEFHDPRTLVHHVDRVRALVAGEGPLHEKYVATRLTRAFGLQRAGSRISEAVLTAIDVALKEHKVRRRGSFIWPPAGDIDLVRVPSSHVDESARTVEHIPPEELELALLRMTETAGTIDPGTLRVNVARIFGFERTGDRIDQALEVRLSSLLAGKRLALAGGLLSVGPKAGLLPMVAVHVAVSSDPFPPGAWVRHPRLGVGRVVAWKGSIVTVDFNGVAKQLESKLVNLTKASKPE